VKYPALSLSSSMNFASEMTELPEAINEDFVMDFLSRHEREASSPGSGAEQVLDLGEIEIVADDLKVQIEAQLKSKKKSVDKDELEGQFCAKVHNALKHVPVEILDDPSFWRYLSVRYFSNFVMWRESSALGEGNVATYVSSKSSAESIPVRMYLRAQAMLDENGNCPLAEAVPEGTDFWRSHIIRVRTGRAKNLAQAFAKLQSTERMITEELRPFARRLNRFWANVNMLDYDKKASDDILKEIKKSLK